MCHDIYVYISEKGRSNLESTDRNCFPVLFSQTNLTSSVHSFLRVSSNLYHLIQKKTPRAGIKTLISWLLNVMYAGLYINFEVLTVVNIWLPVFVLCHRVSYVFKMLSAELHTVDWCDDSEMMKGFGRKMCWLSRGNMLAFLWRILRKIAKILRWFPRFQVATTCFSCSPPNINLLVTNFIFSVHVK